jgi:hypothetical protein
MHTADSTTKATILSHFPERIQAALRAYGVETNLSPESVVKLAISYFLESADLNVDLSDQGPPNVLPNQNLLAHLPYAMQKGIEQYAAEYEFPAEFVVELAVTFLLDPDASSFEDCQVGVQKEQIHLLQQYRRNHQAEAA